ncbi:glycoside hydrolase family 127 protein [Salinisphaera sp. RV14]|uniref:glycoside hydrolase family 127 protein n=1 Tax=Salinisphaera sp. RV14 TaxID=3454140 RepID=UPI003F851945
MAHLARRSDDPALQAACERLWQSMASRQMYVTGGIGAQAHEEAFTVDYDLPNDTVYAETCAAIGLIFFARQMLLTAPDREYADAMERSLYNNVLAGIALDGQHFFYVNPIEVVPEAIAADPKYRHVKPVRQRWFTCACCPPNIARLLSSIDEYVHTVQDDTVYIHLYIGGEYTLLLGGTELRLRQQSELPWDGRVSIVIDSTTSATVALRIPAWAAGFEIRVNGETQTATPDGNGYVALARDWRAGDTIELALDMPARRVHPNPAVRHDAGQVALQRGPLVYCLEQADNGPGLHRLLLPCNADIETKPGEDILRGMTLLTADTRREKTAAPDASLYRYDRPAQWHPHQAVFVPYFAWANRGEGEMRVWVRSDA